MIESLKKKNPPLRQFIIPGFKKKLTTVGWCSAGRHWYSQASCLPWHLFSLVSAQAEPVATSFEHINPEINT